MNVRVCDTNSVYVTVCVGGERETCFLNKAKRFDVIGKYITSSSPKNKNNSFSL